jgi:hypothetical protein
MTVKKQLGIAALVLLVLLVLMTIISIFRQHTDYAVLSTYKQESNQEDQYESFHNTVLRYGSNGISCMDSQNKVLWSQTFEMERPILAMSDSYIVVADQSGNDIWLFDENGYVQQMSSTYQILQVAVSNEGTVAAALERNKNCYLQMYNSAGELTAGGEAHLKETGYPVAIALSSDGKTLAVSYLNISTGSLSSTVTFYNFSGEEEDSDHVLASFSNEGLTIARLAYLKNGNLVAFGNTEVQIYSGGESPELKTQLKPDGNIVSIFVGSERFGLVLQNQQTASGDAEEGSVSSGDSAEGTYRMEVYKANGKKAFLTDFSIAYDKIYEMENGEICIQGNSALVFVSKWGRVFYEGKFEQPLLGLTPLEGYHRYYLVFPDRSERIHLK